MQVNADFADHLKQAGFTAGPAPVFHLPQRPAQPGGGAGGAGSGVPACLQCRRGVRGPARRRRPSRQRRGLEGARPALAAAVGGQPNGPARRPRRLRRNTARPHRRRRSSAAASSAPAPRSSWRSKGVPVVLCEKGHIAGEQSSRNWGWCRKMGRDPREIPAGDRGAAPVGRDERGGRGPKPASAGAASFTCARRRTTWPRARRVAGGGAAVSA